MTNQKQTELFSKWLKSYKALFFKVVRVYAFTKTDRDDLFQEICIQVWQSVPTFKEESKVSTWLYRISLNTALKWKRSEKKHTNKISDMDNSLLLPVKQSEEVDERLEWIYDEISRLDEVDRLLTLLLLDGFSYKEMAHILGITESNVGVKIHRIKQYLITQSKKYEHNGI